MKRRTATRRQRRSPEEIAELLGEYQRSELTQRAFADWKGLSLSSLSLWLRKARALGSAAEGGAPSDSSRLVPVRIRSSAGAGFELQLGGRTVRIPADFDSEALRRLLEVLEPRC